MTYALSWPLQKAVYESLGAAPALAELAGRIHDHPPQPADGAPYLLIGDETVSPWGAADARGAAHVLTLSLYAPARGFAEAKRLAGLVSSHLEAAALSLARGRLVRAAFTGARTAREQKGALRRVDLTFEFVLEDGPEQESE